MQQRLWVSVPEIADDVRAALAGGDESHAFRMMMDGLNRLPIAQAEQCLDEALVEPKTVGNVKWDTLLAGSVRYKLHSMGIQPAPAWTRKPPLRAFWWPNAYTPEKRYNDMVRTPPELERLNIFFDRNEYVQA